MKRGKFVSFGVRAHEKRISNMFVDHGRNIE